MSKFDFAKYAVVEDLTTVPEKYRGLYVEIKEGDNTGKHHVGEFAKGLVADYSGAYSALDDERGKTKNLNDENAKRRIATRAFEDLCELLGIEEDGRNADGLKGHIEEIAAKAKNGEALKIDLSKVREEMAKKHAVEMDAKDGEIKDRDTALARHLIENEATQEISKQKGKVGPLMPHVRERCKVVRDETGSYSVRVLDGDGNVRFNGSGAPMNVSDVVTELKANTDFAGNFESEAPGGGGTKPGATSKLPPNQQQGEKSAQQKIADGLKTRQRVGA